MRCGVAEVWLLVVLRRGQDVIGVEAGGVHPPVDRHDELERGPQLLEKEVLAAARAPEYIAADLKDHLRWRLLVRRAEAFPPAALDPLAHVVVERALHGGVVPLGLVPAPAEAAVVVPEEDGRDHAAHARAAVPFFGDGDLV